MNYFNFHLGDWASHTSGLTMAERGAYLTILAAILATEKPVTKDRILVMCKASNQAGRKVVESVLNEFFYPTEGGYTNKRAQEEIAAFAGIKARSKENGKKGGRPRKTETQK